MPSLWFLSRYVGLALFVMPLKVAHSEASRSSLLPALDVLEGDAARSSYTGRRSIVESGSSNELVKADGPISDLALRRVESREIARPKMPKMPKVPQLHISMGKITMLSTAILATVGYAALICGFSAPVCAGIGAAAVIIGWLSFFFVEATKEASTGSPVSFLEPGDHHIVNVGKDFFEFDNLLAPFVGNDTLALAHLQGYFDELRDLPQHTLAIEAFEDGTAAITAHLPGSDISTGSRSLEDDELDPESPDARNVMVKKVTYIWNRNNRKRYNKLGTKKQRKGDGKKLGDALGEYVSHQRRKGYCMTFHDRDNDADVDKGTFYLNGGKGVNNHCE